MKKRYLLFLLIINFKFSQAQPYANEWISFSNQSAYSLQQYFKISVWKEGIYRITYNDLLGVNVPLPSMNPKKMKLYRDGREQYIFLSKDTTAWDNSMYIEFYGTRNDGTFDTQMYDTDTSQVNDRFSLVNDTAAYFLTCDPGGPDGKRMILETDVNFAAYPQSAYVIRETYKDFGSAFYNPGYQNDHGLTDNSYISGETWGCSRFTYNPNNGGGGTFAYGIPTPNIFLGGPNGSLETVVVGANNSGDIPSHQFTLSVNNNQYVNDYFNGYEWRRYKLGIPPSGLSNGVTNFVTQALPTGGGPNSLTIPFITLRYPHSPDFAGEPGPQAFFVEGGNAFGKAYLNLTGTSLGGGNPVLYAISGDTIRKITVVQGANLQTLVPAGAEQYCWLTSDGNTFSTVANFKLKPVNNDPSNFAKFVNYGVQGLQGDYIIVTHPSLWQEAGAYKTYRASMQGGSRQVILADVTQLVDQFAYGINGHPMAIRNFCDKLIDHLPAPPKDLFLIGKSISMDVIRGPDSPLNLVPTYGYPPSDMMITAGLLDSTNFKVAIPTGRLSARTPGDVTVYLNKVMEYESAAKADWMKNVLHFCGGSDQGQNNILCAYLDEYRQIIEDTLFGGKVYTFSKSSADPISNINSIQLKDLINNGVSIMTFFAHAAGSSFDISTDAPSTYQNQGKYPIIIANSCYIGDIHSTSTLASEEFVILADKGAIAFIAQPNQGYEDFLAVYSNNLYRNISYLNYGKDLASSMKYSVDTILAINPGNFYYKSTCMGMTLHGDPAIVPNSFAAPDLFINNASLFTNPVQIKSEQDTFQLKIYVRNLGKAVNNPFFVEVRRIYPDQTDTVMIVPMNYVSYGDTLSLTLRTAPERGSGFTTIEVRVDYYNQLAESDESNNRGTLIFNIQSSDILPVYPYKYAIIPGNTVTLKASTADPFAPVRTYRFEVDTDDDFINPLLTNDVSHSGGVVTWALPITLDSNRVYYWRVADKNILTDTVNHHWNESSFIYKPGKTGWSQAHFYQFKHDEFKNIVYNRPATTFDFVSTQSLLLARNTLFPFGGSVHPIDFSIDNVLKDYGVFDGQHCLHVAVIDSLTLQPWETRHWAAIDTVTGDTLIKENMDHYFHNINDNRSGGRTRNDMYFVFHTDSVQLNYVNDMISQVPNGNYILIYSVFSGDFSNWPVSLQQTMTGLGADSILTIEDYQPWIFFCEKGDPLSAIESVGDSINTDISLSALMGGNWSKGFITSEVIGPATRWTGLHWAQHSVENPSGTKDSMLLKLIGIDKHGNTTDVIPQILKSTTDINNLDQVVDAKLFPYLKFNIYLQDDSLKSPPQLDRWQIYYDEVPEAAINPSRFFSFYSNPLPEGDTARLTVALENIGITDFADSMLVDYYLYDQYHQRLSLGSPRYKKLKAGEVDTLTLSFSTAGKQNTNSLWAEANPNDNQPEQFHFNNFAQINFDVTRDITNPVLDVTFDGVHILNGDIISSKPYIVMQLTDENKFLALNDTSHWRIFLKDPDGVQQLLHFENSPGFSNDPEKLKWTPAQMPKNSFKIEFNPSLAKDGVYELTIDASSDVSGNESGKNRYQITFEIINRSTITHVVNYPNPFSSSTRFVFTLTGSEVPDYFKIQIMTVSGKIVREIMREELGNIHIGRNISDYAWDGKDEFGDQLANGIYLYRVITSINGSGIERRSTEADKYFKKGYGKMYLMR